MARECGSSNKSEKEDNICHDVPVVLQEDNWDCGIACTKMVLQYLNSGDFEEDKFTSICKQLDFQKSVWTIDIASIFNKYELKHLLCTQTLGVDQTYETEAFYQNQSFTNEEKRINTLFEQAASHGICIEKRSVDIAEIIKHLKAGHVIIVLVDSSILSRYELSTNSTDSSPVRTAEGYQGHFIVVCGYVISDQLIQYRDPGFTGLFQSEFDNFDKARKAYGTDEDILFVYRHKTGETR